jgi:peptidoglycan hydrolase-like protein with peptidoglycan-binding domain
MENNGILKSFDLQDELNSKIWIKTKGDNYVISQKVREKLLEIVYEFIESLKVDIIVSDVHLTGSLVNYNWSQYSDFDLHIIADFNQFPKKSLPLYEELFKLKKTIFNSEQNIKIYGYDVEVFVQDENEKGHSAGIFSLISNDWLEKPKKEKFEVNKSVLKKKTDQWIEKIDKILESAEEEKDLQKSKKIIDNLKTKLKEYRKIGLEKGGEMSYENLVFKYLRRSGHIEKLFSFKKERLDKGLSLNESNTTIGGIFTTDLENGPKNHGSRAFGNWQSDNAWDLFARAGTVVNSYTKGVVAQVYDTGKNSGKVFGTQVTISGKDKYPDIFYTHLKNVKLKRGDEVNLGDYIGEISEWVDHKNMEHVHIGLPIGRHLKELLVNDKKIFTGSKSSESKSSVLQPPLDKLSITSGYGKRGGKEHGGVDYGTKTGTPIKSPADGKVTSADFENNNCGGTLAIQHGDGYKTRYCHVSEFKVSIGDVVKQGQVVALTGGGEEDKGKGNSKGPHLHFELYLNGKNVNPEDYLGSTVSTPDFSRGGGNGSSKVLDELLENADKSGFLIKLKELGKSEKKLSNQSRKGGRIPYDEDVERMQIGLQFLGHSLPVWGIDGLFGPETESAVTSFQKESRIEETGVMESKDLQYLYATLVLKGFEEADLSKINFKGGYDDNILDVSPDAVSADFETMTKIIVDNIEGGYYNPEWHRQAAMGRSGETMFGMDRVHGSDLFKTGDGKEFWRIIDKNKNKEVWKHYYKGGPLESELLKIVTKIMTKHYQDLSDKFLSDKSKKLVESNNGLKLHFYYASWNGNTFFESFAKKINQAVDDDIVSPEKLLSIAINSRLNMPIMKKSGEKLLKIFKSNNIT